MVADRDRLASDLFWIDNRLRRAGTGALEVGIKPNVDLNLLTDNVKRNIDSMFIITYK